MAATRPIWSGTITFGLVNIPVKLFTAVREQRLSFHMLHDQDNVRLKRKMVCPADNKEIHPADRMRTHNAYERVITHDVFDLARRECSVARVAVCGASLGAYHAANIAFRHPDAVSHLISLSGAFDISSFFDGYYDDNIYFNSPYDYLPNIDDPWKFNHMGIVLGTGEWDNTRHESMRLSRSAWAALSVSLLA